MGGRGAHIRLAWAAALCAAAPWAGGAARAQSLEELRGMSIDQLTNVDVTSVSKRTERLSDAAAAVYVITHDDILRSGAKSLPEILRLDPNLEVAEISADSYAITARGFNGNAADKLLVMIDGRSVYTPLFGGVLWDEQDVLPEDIERIEVIDGPGATLWGANAVNGVINIITRKSAQTEGGSIDLSAGDVEDRVSAQYGGKLSDDLTYRAYFEDFSIRGDKTSAGAPADDGWTKGQGGVRLDWTPTAVDDVTLQGDLYHGFEQQPASTDLEMIGGDAQVNWQRQLGGGATLDVLSYFDEDHRMSSSAGGYTLLTYDLEAQENVPIGERQQVVWGLGGRIYQDQFRNIGDVTYLPEHETQGLADIFGQDSIELARALNLTVGLKLEKDPYAGVSPLPTARLSWKATDKALVWIAASRAVRAPTIFDEDLRDAVIPSVLVLTGNRNFQTEKLWAFETGTRVQLTSQTSFSASAYYNVYDDLRSVEWLRMTPPLPLLWTWGNLMQGHTYGLEFWADYTPADWWRLTAGLNVQHEQLSFKPGASSLNSTADAGDDPNSQASLQSTIKLGPHVSWFADLRYVGALPDPRVPAYVELDSNIAWDVTRRLQLYVTGANLLNPYHLEYEEAGATIGDEVQRNVSVGTRFKF